MSTLVGDIGGTKISFGLAELEHGQILVNENRVYSSHAHDSLASAIRLYVAETGASIKSASLAVPGPVTQGVCKVSNLPWQVSAEAMTDEFGYQQVTLLNDLEAIGWGVSELREEDTCLLTPKVPKGNGNMGVMGLGTGLGEAGLFWNGSEHLAFPTEGGHTDFSPCTQVEWDLLCYLQERFGRISWERVVSGMALPWLLKFFMQYRPNIPVTWFDESIPEHEIAAHITKHAIDKDCEISQEIMTLFVNLCGREAGNLALKLMTLGGIYIGGGVATKILPLLHNPEFMTGFLDKGRMCDVLNKMPIRVIYRGNTALLGAARYLLKKSGQQ